MIDTKVIEADARANIADWPAKGRHKGRVVQIALQAIEDMDRLMSGGLLDDMSFGVVAIESDFGDDLPKTFDAFEIQLGNGEWLMLQVRNTPDRYDPVSPTLTIYLQSPSK